MTTQRLKNARTFCALFLIIGLATHSHAARHDSFAISLSPAANDLTQRSVRVLYQDAHGFVWIGTAAGLHRYDGSDVLSFIHDRSDESTISNDAITGIVEDRYGSIWVATSGGGLNLINSSNYTFTSYREGPSITGELPLSSRITSLYKSSSGDLWIGYGDGTGFSRLSPDTKLFEHYFLSPTPGTSDVVGFAEEPNGDLYIAVDGGGVYFKPVDGQTQVYRKGLPDDAQIRSTSITRNANGGIVLTTQSHGIYSKPAGSSQFTRHPIHSASNADTLNEIFAATTDADGNYWVGTTSGIAVYTSSDDVIWYTQFNSPLPDDQILSVMQSQSGMIWIGTYNGLAYASETIFQGFDTTTGLPDDAVSAIESLGDEKWVVGTDSGVAVLEIEGFDTGEWYIKDQVTRYLPEEQIMSLATFRNTIWAGTYQNGLYEIDLDTGIHTQYRVGSDKIQLGANGISVLEIVFDDTLIVGTYGGGLTTVDLSSGLSTARYNTDPSDTTTLSDNRVLSVLETSNGEVWVGTQNGLNLLDTNTGYFYRGSFDPTDESTLSSGTIFSLAEDTTGNLWIGTQSGGLNRLSEKNRSARTFSFDSPEGVTLPSANIYNLEIDNRNRLWISSNNGLSMLDLTSGAMRNFDESHGLISAEFNYGASHATAAGTVIFGGQEGFNAIDAKSTLAEPYDPPLRITRIQQLNDMMIFDQPYHLLEAVTLENDYQFVLIGFSALEYLRPESIQYRYMISGIHKDWIDLNETKSISVSGLPHGTYNISINSTNTEGTWTDQTASLAFTISPPFWLTNTAFSLYLAAFISSIVAYFRRQRAIANEQFRRRQELEDQVRSRTEDLQVARNEAEAAANAKSDFLATMSHEIRTPLHGIIGMTDLILSHGLTPNQRERASTVKHSANDLLAIINDILDLAKLDASKETLNKCPFDANWIADQVAQLQSTTSSKKGLTLLTFPTPNSNLSVVGDESKIRQCLTNLVGNAIKFTEHGYVQIRVSIERFADENKALLSFEVEDDGIGIPEVQQATVFGEFNQADAGMTRRYGGTGLGLSITKRYVDLMQGEISLSSAVGSGSVFGFTVPVDAHETLSQAKSPEIKNILIEGPDNPIKRSLRSVLASLDGCADLPMDRLRTSQPSTRAGSGHYADRAIFSVKDDEVLLVIASATTHSTETTLKPPFTRDNICAHLTPGLSAQHPESQKDNDIPSVSFKALVAEDILVNQDIAASMLTQLGADVTLASNGAQAFEAARDEHFDIIFMDCQMPVMDGYEATRRIRDMEKNVRRSSRSYIIALTAGNSADDRQRAIESGMDDFLQKPFERTSIREAIHSVKPVLLPDNHRSDPEPLTSSTKQNLIDHEVVNRLQGLAKESNSPALLSSLKAGYDEQFTSFLHDLEAALDACDRNSIKKIYHGIKSMSANVGAKEIKTIIENLENCSEQQEQVDVATQIGCLREAHNRFEAEFTKWL